MEAVEHLATADRRMAELIRTVGPCRLEPSGFEHPFAALVETIVYQQLTGKAAATIFRRVEALFRGPLTPIRMLRVPGERLRGAGLSGPKIRSLQDLARRMQRGELDLDGVAGMETGVLATRLQSVKGIGPWSVQMILIFRLGRPDVWPVTDLGIRKGAQRLWGLTELPDPEDLELLGEPLAPWRSIASWYLWRSLDVALPDHR